MAEFAAFEIRNLTFSYPDQEKKALNNVSLSVRSGEFLVCCGKSGCGKSTLLRHLKSVLTPHGVRSGKILYQGKPLEQVSFREQSAGIGYVQQNPDNQIVTDKVWHELAFGLESLGCDQSTIRLRVAEMASFFGIQTWFHKKVTELSGGQKQLLNLAAIMAMQPSVLILDEPTSQLDPIAASEFLETIRKINRELGTTVILTEHRLEEVFPAADRVLVMDQGSVLALDAPRTVGEQLKKSGHDMFLAMPAPVRIYAGVNNRLPCPLTVREGRDWLSGLFPSAVPAHNRVEPPPKGPERETVIQCKDVWFRYEKNAPDVIKDLSFTVKKGQMTCIVGGNGTGKTTALSLISGILTPYRGKVLLHGKEIKKYASKELFTHNLGVLPQNPQALFVKKTVELDLLEMLSGITAEKLSREEKQQRVIEVSRLVEIESLLSMHPYDLSGGEQQRAALAKVLLLKPRVLLLDEPTKGLDNYFKQTLAAILQKIMSEGGTVLMVSHDIEFCAQYAHSCALFFDGSVVTENPPRAFFSGNSFYTTAANRMSRHLFPNAVTDEDVIRLCNLNQ
ncbi:MAG: ATP-binding cassette domain-containing protein [Clostridiales bacterium]|jgi:energy-coupling factor transporter ATP-binding protein EcfA2|nr:ATP-binding cassette domain-containing protein [Clostridiales bacterium]